MLIMIVCITQPRYLPWLGFFGKIASSDITILYDTAQFVRRGIAFNNRNKIRTPDGWMWLTVPVIAPIGTKIKDVKINNKLDWQKKHWKSIEYNYRNSMFFNRYKSIFEKIYSDKFEYLNELNLILTKNIIEILGIKTTIMLASEIGESGLCATNDLLWYCKKVYATKYLSGPFGKKYLEYEKFKKENIDIKFIDYKHPEYKQLYNPFEPFMSIIDLIFNHGPNSLSILMKENESFNKIK